MVPSSDDGTGPIVGAPWRTIVNRATSGPRWSGLNMSAREPPYKAKTADPIKPANARQPNKVTIVGDNAAAREKTTTSQQAPTTNRQGTYRRNLRMHQCRRVGGHRAHSRGHRSEVQKLNPDKIPSRGKRFNNTDAYKVEKADTERCNEICCLEVLLDLLLHA